MLNSGDGIPNLQDIFPNDPAESSDLDGDGIGDNSDPDRDGDGFTNDEEVQGGSNPDDANDVPGANLRISFAGTNPSTSEEQFVDLTGAVYGDTINRVYLTSTQFVGTSFAATVTNNTWTARIALKLGANSITAHVEGNAGEIADSVTSVQRTEPALVVDMLFDTPANNSLVDTPDVVVTGRVLSEAAVELPQVSIIRVRVALIRAATHLMLL